MHRPINGIKKIPDRLELRTTNIPGYFYIILHNAFKFPFSFLLLCRYSLHPLKNLYVSDLFLNNVSFLFFFRQILTNALIFLTIVTCQRIVPTMRAPFLVHVSRDTLGMAYLAVVHILLKPLPFTCPSAKRTPYFFGSYLQTGNIFLVKIMRLQRYTPFQREKYCFSGCDYLAVMLSFMTSLIFSHFLLLTLHNLMAWRLLCCI